MIYLYLAVLAFLIYALWKIRPRQQTVFFTRSFTPPKNIVIYLDGKLLVPSEDYIETDGVIVFQDEPEL